MIQKKLHYLLLLFGLSIFSTNLSAQQCGTSIEDQKIIVKRLLQNKEYVKEVGIHKSGAITYLPVKIHIATQSDGTEGISELSAMRMLCRLNEAFFDQDYQFFLYQGFNYINNSTAFTEPSGLFGEIQLSNNKVDGVINIYICQNANPGGTSLGTTLGFYDPAQDWIILRKQEANYTSATLPHEMGHLLSLPHPFFGWDAEVYDANTHGNPVQAQSPGGVPTENQARSGACKNCDNAGDFICDTPPDYNFGFTWNGCSEYTVNTLDPCGERVDPMENNWMSYFEDCPDYMFTQDQKDLMAADVARRFQFGNGDEGINSSFQPSSTNTVSMTPGVLSPADEEQLGYYNVTIDWETAPGALGYYFEIDQFPSFSVFVERYQINDGSSKIALDLQSNRTYYWRVLPYTELGGCAETAGPFSFTTGDAVAVDEIDAVNAWSVSPNPVQVSNELNVQLDVASSFDASIVLYNIAGQAVSRLDNQRFNAGENTAQIALDGVNNGMYILAIENQFGVLNQKVVVAR